MMLGPCILGMSPGSFGSYVLNGPGLTFANDNIGEYGAGSFSQSAGTNSSYYMVLGEELGSSGTYSLSGGSLRAVGYETVGSSGNGLFTQTGGTNSTAMLQLDANGGSGTYNLQGGLLSVTGMTAGVNGFFNFSGGTLQAAASFNSTVPIYLPTAGSIGTIDTNGNALALGAPLSGAGGIQKVSAGTLTLMLSSSYSGPTILSAGALVAANGNTGSATGSGAVMLNGGTLAAGPTGTIGGPVQAGSGPHTIAPGYGLSPGQYGTLNLLGGLTTNANTTLLFDANTGSAIGMNGGNPIYGGDLVNLGTSSLVVGYGSRIALAAATSGASDYRLFAGDGGSPVLTNFSLPSESGVRYTLSTTADPGYIDLVATPYLAASGGTWTAAAGGSWYTAGNWSTKSPAIPCRRGTVYFPGAPGAPITVTLDGQQSADALVFNVSNSNGYTLAGGQYAGGLTLGTSAGGSITVAAGSHTISAPMTLDGDLSVSVAAGAALQLAGSVNESVPGTNAAFSGPGAATVSGAFAVSGNATVDGGTLAIASGGQLSAGNESVGNTASAGVAVSGGSNTVSGSLVVGNNPGGNATYALKPQGASSRPARALHRPQRPRRAEPDGRNEQRRRAAATGRFRQHGGQRHVQS